MTSSDLEPSNMIIKKSMCTSEYMPHGRAKNEVYPIILFCVSAYTYRNQRVDLKYPILLINLF